ncbi:MAG: YidC/Oxa1 family membrane protein insertase [Anaerolineae bacterium]|nr:YidC/Oxa1 family membrane protein insertase [Anaerolineae bacterium]MDW8173063.1 YidC/Oxa1 family membrane protein insertase [Anaerolineae bacterium]
MWDLIINPFVTILTWLYAVLNNNIVLAIVIFTALIRVLTLPLMVRQQQSAARMQELQPQLKKLQEKYKDDREKLAQAQMELYREAGVNPFGGCLPLLIQFPIIIALYQAIYFALAATPYQLVDLSERLIIPGLDGLIPLQNMWLGMDLTQPPAPPTNPIYALVLPVLVMATTYFQSKMAMPNMSNVDPNDQAAAMTRSMTTIMPIMFGMFALSFSVGLSIYFIVGNVLGILQYSPQGKKLIDRVFGSGPGVKVKPIEKDEPAPATTRPSSPKPSAKTAPAPSSGTSSKPTAKIYAGAKPKKVRR